MEVHRCSVSTRLAAEPYPAPYSRSGIRAPERRISPQGELIRRKMPAATFVRRPPDQALLVSHVPTTTRTLMMVTIEISPPVIPNMAGV